ncbi:MAG: hypothetical protein NW241_18030 [Bacteroidia bacterium]|nr:hypothetical protein [Bacteroidia bacterium]
MKKPSYTKPTIWIVDTSVFCNILDIPGRNQDRESVLNQFEAQARQGDLHMLPFTSVLETGNHIGQLADSGLRKKHAETFNETIKASIDGEAPWKPIAFPSNQEFLAYLDGFPFRAQAGTGFGDHLIIKQWEVVCKQFPGYIVKIWSKDSHLAGYECNH